jgi:pyruvate,water dikinase
VPEAERARFDDELADARAVMDVRDDNGPTTYEWPAGLLRRGLLEAGRRLAVPARIEHAHHVFDATAAEVVALLAGGGPSAAELARRHGRRLALAQLDPPATLGPAEAAPDPVILPPALRRIVTAVQTALTELGMVGVEGADPLSGAGIGTGVYRGRVRRAASADEAIETMEPGDVLVVRATSPAFNAVLGIAGAVVTADGGPLSHAAVLARELGIPAVVGATGALDLVDGATVEVDATEGCVRVIA